RVFAKMMGYEFSEIMGKNILDFVMPESHELIESNVARGYEEPYEVLGRRKDGSSFPVVIHGKTFEHEGGTARVVAIRDISDRKRSEKELKEREEDYRNLFDNAADLIAIVDTKGKFIDLNKKFEEESFYKREDMIGKNIATSGIVTKESAIKVMMYLGKIIAGEEVPIFELEGIRKDGERVPYELRAVPIKKDGKLVALQGILRNITERKASEDALRENEEKLRLITENTSDLVCVTTLQGICTYISPSHKQVLGYESEDLLGKSGYDFIHPEDVKHVKQIARKYTAKKLKSLFTVGEESIGEILEYRFRNKAGEWRDIEATANIVKSLLGKGYSVIFISRDVTERKGLRDKMHQQQELLTNIMSNIPHFVFWKNTESVYLGCNENFAKVAGVGVPENIVGKIDYDLAWKKEESDFFRQCDREVIDNCKPMLNIEEPQLQADGREAIILTSKVPLMDADGDVFGILGIYADITDRKSMEEILRKSEARYRTIFENTGSSTIIVEEDLGITMANAQFERLSGYHKKDLRGKKNLIDFISEGDRRRVQEFHRLRMIDPSSAPKNYELTFTNKNRKQSEIYITVALIPGTSRSVISILDISELKENERELKRQKELLDNTNKALEHKLKELEEAMGHIKKLEGLVPICARCKKMRVEGGDPKDSRAWVRLEKYISDRTDASFTHGLCPECIKEMYGDFQKEKE
ncbi:MAG: PAS domain S-box protein, partial [Candidatus Omnitrophota bacterium]